MSERLLFDLDSRQVYENMVENKFFDISKKCIISHRSKLRIKDCLPRLDFSNLSPTGTITLADNPDRCLSALPEVEGRSKSSRVQIISCDESEIANNKWTYQSSRIWLVSSGMTRCLSEERSEGKKALLVSNNCQEENSIFAKDSYQNLKLQAKTENDNKNLCISANNDLSVVAVVKCYEKLGTVDCACKNGLPAHDCSDLTKEMNRGLLKRCRTCDKNFILVDGQCVKPKYVKSPENIEDVSQIVDDNFGFRSAGTAGTQSGDAVVLQNYDFEDLEVLNDVKEMLDYENYLDVVEATTTEQPNVDETKPIIMARAFTIPKPGITLKTSMVDVDLPSNSNEMFTVPTRPSISLRKMTQMVETEITTKPVEFCPRPKDLYKKQDESLSYTSCHPTLYNHYWDGQTYVKNHCESPYSWPLADGTCLDAKSSQFWIAGTKYDQVTKESWHQVTFFLNNKDILGIPCGFQFSKVMNDKFFQAEMKWDRIFRNNGSRKKLPLREISITGTQIQSLPKGIFANLRDLVGISLSNNKIKNLDRSVFEKYDTQLLEHLNLANNLLTNQDALSETFFDDFNYLKMLYLDENNLDYIEPNWFKNKRNLQYIYLNGQRNVDCLNGRLFNNLPNLESLSIADLNLKEMPENIFENTKAIKYLYAEKNPFVEFSNEAIRQIDFLGMAYFSHTECTPLGCGFQDLDPMYGISRSCGCV